MRRRSRKQTGHPLVKAAQGNFDHLQSMVRQIGQKFNLLVDDLDVIEESWNGRLDTTNDLIGSIPQGGPGDPGADGEDGDRGPAGLGVPGRDGDDGADGWTIPGRDGAPGAPGISIMGPPGDDGDDGWTIPGKDGTLGSAGATGAAGSSVTGPPGRDGDDADDLGWFGRPASGPTQPQIITPTQIAANQNDYSPAGWKTADIVRLSTDATRTITGFDSTDIPDGHRKLLMNVGANRLNFTADSASSSAANRIHVGGGTAAAGTFHIREGGSLWIEYDVTESRWRMVGGPAIPGTSTVQNVAIDATPTAGDFGIYQAGNHGHKLDTTDSTFRAAVRSFNPQIPGLQGEDGDDGWSIPGQPGAAGAAGAAGASVTGPQGPVGQGIDGQDGDDGWTIPGQPGTAGAAGSTGATGPQGPAVPGPPGADGDDGDAWPILGPKPITAHNDLTGRRQTSSASTITHGADSIDFPAGYYPNPSGGILVAGTGDVQTALDELDQYLYSHRLDRGPMGPPGDDGDDSLWSIPGQPGQAGAAGSTGSTGPQGPAVPGSPGADGDDGDSWPIPGSPGQPGPQGPLGQAVFGEDGDDGWPLPGPQGSPGTSGTSVTGPQGPIGQAVFGEDGDDAWHVPGPMGPTGRPGAMSFYYRYSTTTADADPTSGFLRFNNNVSLSAADKIYVSNTDVEGNTISAVLDSWDDSGTPPYGYVTYIYPDDVRRFQVYTLSLVEALSGYHRLSLTQIDGSGIPPPANVIVVLSFSRAGASGATGSQGPIGQAVFGEDGDDGWAIPGQPGAAGVAGPAGSSILGPPGLDGDDGIDAFPVQGPAGASDWTAVQQDLGATARRSGSFTLTVANSPGGGRGVSMTQIANALTGKGTRSDENEMDTVNFKAVTRLSNKIDVFWSSHTLVRGNFRLIYSIV